MLEVLDNFFMLAPDKLANVRGILIVFDARDDGPSDITNLVKQFPAQFGRPTEAVKPVKSLDGRPAIAVMPIPPHQKDGSLETLCIEAIRHNHKEVVGAVESCLNAEPVTVNNWSAEKRDKAKLACFIAATNEENPTKPLRWCFEGRHHIIDVKLAVLPRLPRVYCNSRRQ